MSIQDSPLGKHTAYVSEYDPSLLHPIPRAQSRQSLGLGGSLPFQGFDLWNGYELSWLNAKGKPVVALAEFRIPCDSRNIIESKSFKLYLNSLNQTRFDGFGQVLTVLRKDLSAALVTEGLEIKLLSVEEAFQADPLPQAICLDELDVEVEQYHPNPDLLQLDASSEVVEETLLSHLLKSNCPVTGQPDWASLIVEYRGRKLDHAALLRYIISFREHQDFHEHCVERIFCDLMARCQPESLTVYARYTRRGGLDINPLRTTGNSRLGNLRLVRQ